jgi:hypothetical protein
MNTPTKGQKIGRIVKIADEGIFSTTTEGQLLRGGLNDGSGSMGGSFEFTIEKPSLKILADKYLNNQKEVIIDYYTPLFSSIFRSEQMHPHFITNISEKD